MPKNIEDIISQEKKRSIRDVPLPENRRRGSKAAPKPVADIEPRRSPEREVEIEVEEEEDVVPVRTHVAHRPEREVPTSHKPRRRRFGLKKIAVGFAVVVLLAFLASVSLFKGATLSYTPKSTTLTFSDEAYTAEKTTGGALVFSVVKLSGDKGISVPATGEEKVERKASGVIIIYNNASRDPQKLVENTRFESPTGKIYRIRQAVTVPGQKTVGGQLEPGTVEVTVYADEAGEASNTALTDFTLPGLKGSARFETIYARSKTPMTGGFVGTAKSVKPEDLEKAKAELETALREELSTQAKAQLPGDFILYPSLSSFSFEELPQSEANGNNVTLNLRGNFYGVMFKKSDLSNFLASKKIALAPGEMIEIPALDSLAMSFGSTAPADLLSANEIIFKVSGEVQALWVTDEIELKKDLVNRKKDEISVILGNYPGIKEAEATIRPFWKSAFPEDPAKISVKRLSVQ
jgi:hypothetical protein